MKYNLKNCPDSEWKRGFKKELREKLGNIPNYKETTIQDSLVNALNDQQKKIIKEILGE